MGTEKTGEDLANSTVSMLISLGYFVAVCWIIPVIPMIIGLMWALVFTAFLTIWLTGSLFIGLAFHYFLKRKKD